MFLRRRFFIFPSRRKSKTLWESLNKLLLRNPFVTPGAEIWHGRTVASVLGCGLLQISHATFQESCATLYKIVNPKPTIRKICRTIKNLGCGQRHSGNIASRVCAKAGCAEHSAKPEQRSEAFQLFPSLSQVCSYV